MRVNPAQKKPDIDPDYPLSTKVEQVTRKVALIIAFISTFLFFFKILFF